MSLTKTLLQEAIANRRKKQVMVRLAKILLKTYDKQVYQDVRELLNNSKYLKKHTFVKVMSKAKNTYSQQSGTDKFAEFWGSLNDDQQLEVTWALVHSFYTIIKATDPTDSGKYLNWLVTAWISPTLWDIFGRMNSFKFIKVMDDTLKEEGHYNRIREDIQKFKRLLKKFAKAKELNNISGEEADINNYQTTDELFDKIEELEKDPEAMKSKREKVMDESNIIYEDEDWTFVVPESHRASCTWGSGTNWCTAVDDGDEDTYRSYMKRGDLIIIVNDDKERKFQVHYDSPEGYWFMDEKDNYAIRDFEYLLKNEDKFTKYISIIVWHSTAPYQDSVQVLVEFDALCDELNQDGLSKHYLPTDFIGDEPLKAFTKDLVKFIKTEEDPNYTKKGNHILDLIDEHKHKGLRKMWDEILSAYKTYVINDVLYQFHESYFDESSKSIEDYFESLMK